MNRSTCPVSRLVLLGVLLVATPAAGVADAHSAATPQPADQIQTPAPPEPQTPAVSGPESLSSGDRAFVQKAMETGRRERALAGLARKKSSSGRVKAFAARLDRDYRQFNRELQQWSPNWDAAMPQGPMAAMCESCPHAAMPQCPMAAMCESCPHAAMPQGPMAAMCEKCLHESLRGAAFDTAYIDTVIKDHSEAIAAFEKQETQGSVPELTMFVQKSLELLKAHLKEAQAVGAALVSPTPSPSETLDASN